MSRKEEPKEKQKSTRRNFTKQSEPLMRIFLSPKRDYAMVTYMVLGFLVD